MIKVIDLEATCWDDGSKDKVSEIIEIGGVTVSLATGEIVDKFQAFIRPQLNPILSDFCTKLTSITQEDVNKARYFNEVYPAFVKWFGSKNKHVLASWGNYDKNQLRKDVTLHELAWKMGDEHWNLKHMFEQRFAAGGQMGLNTAVQRLGMEFVGTHHRGISDAENAGNVLVRMFHGNQLQLLR